MPSIVVIGMQWGDEGKGKIVDVLSENFTLMGMPRKGLFRALALFDFAASVFFDLGQHIDHAAAERLERRVALVEHGSACGKPSARSAAAWALRMP